MLFPGTEMHVVTFGFICLEVILLVYLCILKIARPENNRIKLDIFLLSLLITYNLTGGLLPDPRLPGSFFVQETLAYGTGFITPCYFPYYVYEGFQLRSMRFHVKKGVALFLGLPFLIFTLLFYYTGSLEKAKDVLIVPLLYAIWIIISVIRSVRIKHNGLASVRAKEELLILLCCLTPWVSLPVIAYFDLSQLIEVICTNIGFLMLLTLRLSHIIRLLKIEYHQLQASKARLQTWNEVLQMEVAKKTKELEQLSRTEKFKIKCHNFRLTAREKEIALMVITGNTYKQVAEQLYIAERTVGKHMEHIFLKVQVSNKMELCHKLST